MEQKKKNAVFWLKGLLWMLMVMFVFTILSKTADSFTVAKVSIGSPSARKIQYTVSAEGRIEKNREISVLTQPDILVKSVLVSEGQHVKKRDVLAKLDMEDLKERIDSINDEKKILELQNSAAEENDGYAAEKMNQELTRAQDDYQQIKQKHREAAAKARSELKEAKAALKKRKNQERQEEQDTLEIPITSLEEDEEEQPQRKEEESLEELKDLVKEKKVAYKDLLETQRAEEKAAKRAVEDAMSDLAVDNSIAINNITIRNLEQQLDKLYELERKKGYVRAPKAGVVTSVLVNVGQRTSDSGIFTMTDDSAGVRFVGQIAREDAKYVSVGDELTLHTADKDFDGIPVTSVEMDESREFMNVTALLLAEDFSIGEMVSMNVLQESKNYSCTVPSSAIHQEDGKNYVYIMETEDTVLGEANVARKMEVNILESNGIYAALEDGAIDSDSQIIVDADHYIEAGDRIRLREE